ncbi:hypothetical protein [Streptomyces tibetensis]|uniref:hypothetical protein n=1 Tax=Streptomyces tibetensis TaxID=2382123 RepID=UPI0034112B42
MLVRSHQLPQAIRLAKRLPEPRLVLDHAGQPPSATGTDRQGTAVADAGPASPGSLQGAGGAGTAGPQPSRNSWTAAPRAEPLPVRLSGSDGRAAPAHWV